MLEKPREEEMIKENKREPSRLLLLMLLINLKTLRLRLKKLWLNKLLINR
jgi:hypothetical protein